MWVSWYGNLEFWLFAQYDRSWWHFPHTSFEFARVPACVVLKFTAAPVVRWSRMCIFWLPCGPRPCPEVAYNGLLWQLVQYILEFEFQPVWKVATLIFGFLPTAITG